MTDTEKPRTEIQPAPLTLVPNKPRAYCFLDLETTGLSILRHGICEVGVYVTGEDEGDVRGYFQQDADPRPCEIEAQALEINKFTVERISAAQPIGIVLGQLSLFLADIASTREVVLVMHGAKFDTPRLEVACERVGLDFPWARRVLDTGIMGFNTAGFKGRGEMLSLKRLCELLGVVNRGAHTAIGDAIATAQCFHTLKDLSKDAHWDAAISRWNSGLTKEGRVCQN
jgi:DNA polymerase-3 subunit epsilon